MSERKYTPGPWGFEPPTFRQVIDNFALRVYAEDPGEDRDFTIGYVRDSDDKVRLAHARLIAAAPELLEALEAIANCLSSISYTGEVWDNELAAARTIIAKAKGE